jgi:hypothetical protein
MPLKLLCTIPLALYPSLRSPTDSSEEPQFVPQLLFQSFRQFQQPVDEAEQFQDVLLVVTPSVQALDQPQFPGVMVGRL